MEGPPFVCPEAQCSFTTNEKHRVRRHALTHSGELPLQCSEEGCAYATVELSHLKRHMLKHTGER